MSTDDALLAMLAELRQQGLLTGPAERLYGPTSSSNIVIPGVVLWGDTPRGKKLAELLDFGVTHFLDLRPDPTEVYLPAASSSSNRPPLFHHQLDIGAYVSTGSVAVVASFLKDVLAQTLLARTLVYVHCRDGHAVSGMAVCALLSYVYGITMLKAGSLCAQLRSNRHDADSTPGLFNAAQKAFLRALCAESSPIAASGSIASDRSLSADALVRSCEGGPHNTSSQRQSWSASGQQNFVLGSGTLGSRFEHSHGSGDGKVSINIFDEPGVPGTAYDTSVGSGYRRGTSPRCNAQSSPEESPTRRGRALVPGISPETLQVGGGRHPYGASQSNDGCPSVHYAPALVLGSNMHSGNAGEVLPAAHQHVDPFGAVSPPQADSAVADMVEALDSATTVVVLRRPSVKHAWGLVLRGGNIVQRVLPHLPAATAGIRPHMQLLCIDGEAYDGHEGIDWVTMDKTVMTFVVADSGHAHTSPPGGVETHPSIRSKDAAAGGGGPLQAVARRRQQVVSRSRLPRAELGDLQSSMSVASARPPFPKGSSFSTSAKLGIDPRTS